MKTALILISSILLTASCLSRKTAQKHTDFSVASEKEKVLTTRQWLYQLHTHDSNTMVWHFRTDAPFIYHPDTGLHAQQGDLWFSVQSAQRRSLVTDSNNTLQYVTVSQQQQEEQTTLTERRPASRKIGWWIMGILTIIVTVSLARYFWQRLM